MKTQVASGTLLSLTTFSQLVWEFLSAKSQTYFFKFHVHVPCHFSVSHMTADWRQWHPRSVKVCESHNHVKYQGTFHQSCEPNITLRWVIKHLLVYNTFFIHRPDSLHHEWEHVVLWSIKEISECGSILWHRIHIWSTICKVSESAVLPLPH